MKFYDMYEYYITNIEIYDDNFYSRRMIYPRKNEKFTFDGLMELVDSIKKMVILFQSNITLIM